MRTRDPVAIIEAAYHVDQAPADWLAGVVRAVAHSEDAGFGALGFLYQAKGDGLHVECVVDTGDGTLGAIAERIVTSGIDRSYVDATYRVLPCAMASETPDLDKTEFHLYRPYGIRDLLGINGVDPTGLGCFVAVPAPRRRALTPARRALFARIAAHIASGHRMVARSAARPSESPAAVLTPEGRLEHAADPDASRARSLLRAATRAIESARAEGGARDGAPERAVARWKPQVDARWTLVDTFESDGKRYVLARCNAAELDGLGTLSERERQVVGLVALGHTMKYIAYELGMEPSTARVLLLRARRKLGVETRAELVALLAKRKPNG